MGHCLTCNSEFDLNTDPAPSTSKSFLSIRRDKSPWFGLDDLECELLAGFREDEAEAFYVSTPTPHEFETTRVPQDDAWKSPRASGASLEKHESLSPTMPHLSDLSAYNSDSGLSDSTEWLSPRMKPLSVKAPTLLPPASVARASKTRSSLESYWSRLKRVQSL